MAIAMDHEGAEVGWEEEEEEEDTTGQEVAVAAVGIHVRRSVKTERPLMAVLVMGTEVVVEEVVVVEVVVVTIDTVVRDRITSGSIVRTRGG